MQLPSAPESEKFLLACAITFPDDLTNIVSELNIPDYFCGPGYREVYEALLQQVGEGMQPDLMTLHALGKGAEFNIRLAEITSIPDTMHTTFFLEANRKRAIETHARIVREAYIKRETQLALSRGEDAKAVLAQFSKLAASGKDRAFSASQIADLFYTQLEEQPDRIPFP